MLYFAAMQWRPHLSPLWCGLLIFAAGAWLWLVYQRLLTRVEPPRARVLLFPKLAVLLLLLLAVLEPVWTVETQEKGRGKVLTLLDTSTSMDVADDGKEARGRRARTVLQKIKQGLPSDIALDEMEFDVDLRKPGETTRGREVRGTDLGGALVKLAESKDISSYLGVLLLTDGGDEPVDSALLPSVPVHIIGFGSNPTLWNDVAIVEAQYPPTVEKDLEFEVNVDLEARAGGGGGFVQRLRKVNVSLEAERDGKWQPLADRSVNLVNQRARVNFPVSCKELGLRHYRVVAETIAGELTPLNNTRHIAVDVQKKSLHLLFFTRELGMDFRTIRSELGRDPGIAFTALFRTLSERFTLQGDRLPGDEELESGFPTSEKTLQHYDCIIIGSFPAEDWTPAQMRAVVKYVEGGGVVVFLGGDKSFGRGGYAKSELAGLFPWMLSETEAEAQTGVFPVKAPMAATGHPMLSGVEDQLVRQGATVESVNPVGDLKPGATALLETRLDQRALAVVALQSYGKGRVLAIASNTLWKWVPKSDALKAAYGLFWRQGVRHLTGKEEGGRVFSIKWDKESYRPGEQAMPEIRAAGQNPEGLRFAANLTFKQEMTPLTVDPLQGQPNTWFTKVRLRGRGDYAFKLTAFRGDNALETYEKVLRIAPLMDEGARLELDEPFLRKLAERGAGAFYRESETGQFIKRVAAGFGHRTVLIESSLAQAGPWFALLFLALLLAEWILRRRRSLI